VGFRPFVYRIARARSLTGFVLNDTLGVLVEVEGDRKGVSSFLSSLRTEAPPLARIDSIHTEDRPPKGEREFRILKSASRRGKESVLPPDIATCSDCLREILDPDDRRFRYAFTNCTNCGPRYTIVNDIPYDRPKTSMRVFNMCPLCQKEYDSPEDRRFHAQPNACATCGPSLSLAENKQRAIKCRDPLDRTVALLKRGAIVAIKGIGGFHLACDAANDAAIRRLRKRKKRQYKPLAIMSQDIATVSKYAHVSDLEREILESYASPIVLLRRKSNKLLSELLAPNLSDIGVMLPYTPLHHILLRNNFLALVMTSGNLTDEPTIAANGTAFEKLGSIADYFLTHDRDILIQNDDSIVKIIAREPVVMRRARGYVPQPIVLPGIAADTPDILAVGGEEKGTVCFVKGGRAFLSQHLGDLKNRESVLSFENTVVHTKRLLKIRPRIVAHDLHPSYSSTKYAMGQKGVRRTAVQHHYAHIAACLAENGVNEKVIGISFDGVGLGTDEKSWGGEFFVADLTGFERVGHLKYVPLPGGDAAAKEPYRMAIAYLHAAFGEEAVPLAEQLLANVESEKIRMVFRMIEKRVNSPLTSSTGRLFDAVASLIGVCQMNTYEGQAPMELESLIWNRDEYHEEFYPYEIRDETDMFIVDVSPMIRSITQDVAGEKSRPYVTCKFHNTMAHYALDACLRARKVFRLKGAALSGGVFQNKYLTEKLVSLLEGKGFTVYRHKLVPPNDGGISLGQAAAAAHQFTKQRR
jgi:hydrogenase maturation protein HypF